MKASQTQTWNYGINCWLKTIFNLVVWFFFIKPYCDHFVSIILAVRVFPQYLLCTLYLCISRFSYFKGPSVNRCDVGILNKDYYYFKSTFMKTKRAGYRVTVKNDFWTHMRTQCVIIVSTSPVSDRAHPMYEMTSSATLWPSGISFENKR